MPRQGQIIPEYLHPHVETYINDNTTFTEQVAAVEDGVRLISVFTSGKGRDGVVLPFTLASDYISEYGNPNYKLYGQPGFMPYASLSTQMAKVWCMRVMPKDAAYSNVIIVAKVKVDKTDAAKPKLMIHHEAQFVPAIVDKNEFSSYVESLASPDPDVNGYTTFPLFGIYSLGRGAYGNNFRIRLTSAAQADKENNYKNFRLEILESDGGLQQRGVFSGSFYGDAIEDNNTIFLGDLVNDSESGSTKLGMYISEDSFDKIYDLYTAEVKGTVTLETMDILFGLNKSAAKLTDIVIDTTVTGAVALDKAEGIPLSGGTDGAFSVSTTDPVVRETAINTAYLDAFAGKTDAAILSKRRTPAELILDANYSDEVKRGLIALILKRYDAYGFIDGGILNTTTDATSWADTMATLGDTIFSKECQHMIVKDPFTGKKVPMTITYFLASALPVHFKTKGNQVPFTGEANAKLVNFVKGSLKPIIDADDSEVKEKLYVNRVNYFECIAENTFVRGTQGTSQTEWSDLSEESNAHVLLELKREIETYVASTSYNFAEAEDRKSFTDVADRIIAPYRGTKLKTASVEFKMSPWEEERSIIHCYLGVTYRTISKRGLVEIDINKRV